MIYLALNYFISYRVILVLLASLQFSYADEEQSIDTNSNSRDASLSTLRFVAIVARHGVRAPMFTYPNDPYPFYDKRFWPQGNGELTNVGKRQFFKLGSKLRERYNGYLTLTYFPNDTFATYNPLNRDFDSVSCLLASLYPPVGNEVWNEELMWQPIPSRVYDFDVCQLLKTDKCPAFKKEAFKMAELVGDEVKNKSSCLVQYVSNHTNEQIKSALQLVYITDTLTMQERNGYKIPAWAESVYPKELREIEVKTMNALYAGSDKIVSLAAGPELKHIGDLLNRKESGDLLENSKMYIELGHDCVLYSLLKAMGSKLGEEKVQTGAHMIFELHQLYSSYIVEVLYYKNESDENPSIVNIKDCPSPCSLKNFNVFIDKISGTESWENACKI